MKKTKLILVILFFVVAVLLASTSYGINRVFGRTTIEQILIHTHLSTSGLMVNSVHGLWYIIIKLYAPTLLLVLCFVLFVMGKWPDVLKTKLSALFERRVMIGITFTLMAWCGTLFLLQYNHQFLNYVLGNFQKSRLDEYYLSTDVDAFQFNADKYGKKRNCIFIISESLEETFKDQRIFQENLIPGLEVFQKEGMVFGSLCTVNGTNYSIASMYGMFYGIPLLHLKGIDGLALKQSCFPGSVSLFDVLLAQGYEIAFFRNVDFNFVGTGSLMAHLPDIQRYSNTNILKSASVQEYIKAHPTAGPKQANSFFGVIFDSVLFYFSKERLLELGRGEKPFFAVIEDVDLHQFNGLEVGQPVKYGDQRDIVMYKDRQLVSFISWFKEQSFAKDTMLVIVGDHCSIDQFYGDIHIGEMSILKPSDKKSKLPQRTCYHCFYNPLRNEPPERAGKRIFTTFDIGPTLLAALGFEWETERLGFGVSLYSDQSTLLEKVGFEKYDAESMKYSPLYMKLFKGKMPGRGK